MTSDMPARAPGRAGAGIAKYSLSIAGHRTSVSLEPAFWTRLNSVALRRDMSLPRLIAEIDSQRAPGSNLASAIRLYILREALGDLSAST